MVSRNFLSERTASVNAVLVVGPGDSEKQRGQVAGGQTLGLITARQ